MKKDLQSLWLALARLPGFGPVKTAKLLTLQPDLADLFDHPPSSLPEQARAYLKEPDWAAVEKDQEWLSQDVPDDQLSHRLARSRYNGPDGIKDMHLG